MTTRAQVETAAKLFAIDGLDELLGRLHREFPTKSQDEINAAAIEIMRQGVQDAAIERFRHGLSEKEKEV